METLIDHNSRASEFTTVSIHTGACQLIPPSCFLCCTVLSQRCFKKSLFWGLFYCFRDWGIVAALYYFQPAFFGLGLAGKVCSKLQCYLIDSLQGER